MAKTCFLVMPFREKATGLSPQEGPVKVDFDRLYREAIEPALTGLGYDVVRADQDDGALIIKEMIERIAYSDLVVADVTIPNGNVYYEIGIRHAARDRGCVLIGASWPRQLFDIDQMRRVVYPLPDGTVPPDVAADVRAALSAGIAGLANGVSPFFQTVQHTPVDPKSLQGLDVFREHTRKINDLMARIRTIEELDRSSARTAAKELATELAQGGAPDYIRKDFIRVLANKVDWHAVLEYIETLDAPVRDDPWVEEQRLLAVAKTGDVETAIGALKQLIATQGKSAERCGLLGGRYKQLWRESSAAGDEASARRHLSRAIRAYEEGMRADLNDYYPSSNLPPLLHARRGPGDLERARHISAMVVEQVQRSLELDDADEWARPTLLVAAFHSGDIDKAEQLVDRVESEGAAQWKLDITIEDLRGVVKLIEDPELASGLTAVTDRLAMSLQARDGDGTVTG